MSVENRPPRHLDTLTGHYDQVDFHPLSGFHAGDTISLAKPDPLHSRRRNYRPRLQPIRLTVSSVSSVEYRDLNACVHDSPGWWGYSLSFLGFSIPSALRATEALGFARMSVLGRMADQDLGQDKSWIQERKALSERKQYPYREVLYIKLVLKCLGTSDCRL